MVTLGNLGDKRFKSYYDIEGDGLEYISDEENLKKIRNKSLRQFLMFYQQVTTSLLTTLVKKQKMSDNDLHNFKGAKEFLSNVKLKEIAKIKKELNPELFEKISIEKKDVEFSSRTIYDYMNTMKYIRAIKKAESELNQALIEEEIWNIDKKCHNMTKGKVKK